MKVRLFVDETCQREHGQAAVPERTIENVRHLALRHLSLLIDSESAGVEVIYPDSDGVWTGGYTGIDIDEDDQSFRGRA